MTNALFAIFATVALLRGFFRERGRVIFWMALSVLAFAQIGQKIIPGVLALLVLQSLVLEAHKRFPRINVPLFPLLYAAVLLTLHSVLHLNLPGFSYLALSSSLDIWASFRGPQVTLRDRAFNLFSFPKTVVGPITGARDLAPLDRPNSEIFKLAFYGVLKAFILVNLWRQYVPAPEWSKLIHIQDYFWFGLWNYVNLFLEFSGTCDLVAASFWLLGFNCPLNFDRPYLSLSISEFWKRWHITLSHWIKNFVYIPFGGSRVPRSRILLNLMLAMVLSGLWHGLNAHYLAWGALQGVFLCVERLTSHEERIRQSSRGAKVFYWLVTQVAVTLSWVVFFAKF